ncbi:MAG TPA: carboxypeptidase regulatory-like domain-containing protein, partial [Acidobacteriota bacterium]|nr:carboxypeptidase regulatory-like domain-containing protein [Acidobacteriota bacterium]
MVKKSVRTMLALVIILAAASWAFAERQTGSIKGRITDKAGFPLPGAFIYVSSPALLGILNYITADTGNYAFVTLPPGACKITVEMPGFKTVNVDALRIHAGQVLSLNIRLEATEIEEEITSLDAAPSIDGRSAGASFVADGDLLHRAPLPRDFSAILGLVPGAVPAGDGSAGYYSFYGSPVRANTFVFGGSDVTNPLDMAPLAALNTDLIEEVDFDNAARPAETYPAQGGYINVITRSGGNSFLGEFRIYHTSKGLSKDLWSKADYADNNLGSPPTNPKLWDFALDMGGPILEDRAWYFADFRLAFKSMPAPFIPWKDPLGTLNPPYDWRNRDLMSFFKVSTQVTSQIRATAWVNFQDRYQPIDESYLTWNVPEPATRVLKHNSLFVAAGSVNYRMDQNTFADFGVGLAQGQRPLTLNPDAASLPYYTDAATGRVWGNAPYNETSTDRRFKGSASITRLQDTFGISHELKAGAEYEDGYADLSAWKDDNLGLIWFDGSPYYFGTGISPKTGKTVGKGLVSFSISSKNEGGFILKNELKRLGFYAQDAVTIARRATLHLGLRFDRSTARIPSIAKSASGNAISVTIGNSLIKPIAGLNPYDTNSIAEWDQLMVWNALSPRIGLSLDLFGDGRTILRSSYSRYSDYMSLGYVRGLSPFLPTRSHSFVWYDEDGKGTVDSTDTYTLTLDDYRIYKGEFSSKRVAEDIKAPTVGELTFGLSREIVRDLSVSARYVSKTQKDIVENVLYDPVTGAAWYQAGGATADWWVPFTTTVPATAEYPVSPVTVYYRSKAAPAVFDQLRNVPELRRKYSAFELMVRKRMSDNWQFFGSVVWSRATGNAGLGPNASSGFSPLAG